MPVIKIENKPFNDLFVERIEELDSANFGQGLYLENLTFTNIEEFSEEATERFTLLDIRILLNRSMNILSLSGLIQDLRKTLSVTFREKTFDVQIINGCAIIKTSEIPHNADGMLSITVNSFEHSNVYKAQQFRECRWPETSAIFDHR